MNIKKLTLFLDNLCNEYKHNSHGLSLGIIIGNKLLCTKSYGLANIRNNELCSEKTNFRLASVTKQFTATAILQLVDKGKINLNDKLTDYFQQFIYAKDVTIYTLLTHTSGLLDYEELLRTTRKTPISDREVLNLLSRQKKLKFKLETSRSYNNGSYCILKEIIEKVSKMSYKDYIEKNIFSQLYMDTSVVSERGKTHITDRAIGYSINKKNQPVKTDNDITNFTIGDGSIYSNIEDLSKRVLGKEKILSPKLFALAQSPLELTDEKDEYYGFGLTIATLNKDNIVYHDGYTIGFRASLLTIPDKQVRIIFLSNLNKHEGSDFTKKIAEFILNNL